MTKVTKLLMYSLIVLQLYFICVSKALYASDGSFRLINDLLSNHANSIALNPLTYTNNRIWIDGYRQLLSAILQFISLDFATLVIINNILQLFGLSFLYFLLYIIAKKIVGSNMTGFLFIPVLIVGPVMSIYLDAQILWAYPIYVLHLLITFHRDQQRFKIKSVLLINLLLTGLHEFTIIYLFMVIVMLISLLVLRKIKFSDIWIRGGLTLVPLGMSLFSFVSNRDNYSTLNQFGNLGLLNFKNLQYSSFTFSFALLILVFVLSTYRKPGFSGIVLTLGSLSFLVLGFSKTSTSSYSNYWVGYLVRNDFALFATIVMFMTIILISFDLKPIHLRKFLSPYLLLSQLLSLVFIFNYTSNYEECWESTQKYISKSGFATTGEVAVYGECHVDWVSPITSLIMGNSNHPTYLVLNSSSSPGSILGPEGRILITDSKDGMVLPFNQIIKDGFLELQLLDLIENYEGYSSFK
jgi:hypothetical protein